MRQLRPVPAEENAADVGLAAHLRPRFAQPVILVDPDDPVIGGPTCLVEVCDRLAVIYGKCSAHHQRWIEDGRPDDVHAWAVTAPANRRWLSAYGLVSPVGYGLTSPVVRPLRSLARWPGGGS